jgi:lysophospholipase L1-like esterase
LQKSYVSAGSGDTTAAERFQTGSTLDEWPFLTGVDVSVPGRGATVVAFGDSLVDGDGSSSGQNHRWTDVLALRLQEDRLGRSFGVLNEGIIGNRLLRDSPQETSKFGEALGESGLKRFQRDVLSQSGVTCVIVRLGINDIGFPGAFAPAAEKVSVADIIDGYQKIVRLAHQRGLRILATTLTPFEGATVNAGYYSHDKEVLRQTVNAWLRTNQEFDGVVDLDQLLRDPEHGARLLGAYDSGDHLHTNDAGYEAAGRAVPLAVLGVQ